MNLVSVCDKPNDLFIFEDSFPEMWKILTDLQEIEKGILDYKILIVIERKFHVLKLLATNMMACIFSV